MSAHDIAIINDLIPCLVNTIQRNYGGIVEEVKMCKPSGSSYNLIKLTVSRTLPLNIYLPSYIISPNKEMLETVCLYLSFCRGSDGTFYEKFTHNRIGYSDYRIDSFTSYRDRVFNAFTNWWKSAVFVLNGQANASNQVCLFKKELIERTVRV